MTFFFLIRLHLVEHLMIKISKRSFDDMESSKRSVKLLSLIFIIRHFF